MSQLPRSLVVVSFLALLANPAVLAQAFTFGPPQDVVIFPSRAVLFQNAAIDMNGDGNTDIYLSLNTGNFIYAGDGTGKFSAPITVGGSANNYSVQGLRFYDVNGDGFADEVFSYAGFSNSGVDYPGVFAVLLGDGKGNFNQTTSIPQPVNHDDFYNPSIAPGDFNHDGKMDFVTTFLDPTNDPGYAKLNVYLNKGGGVFESGLSTEVVGSPSAPVVGDFNGDGNQDIVWLDSNPEAGSTNRFAVHCIYGNGDGTFKTDTICYVLDGAPYKAGAADFNHDGMTDLVVYTTPKVGAVGAQARLATLFAKKGGFYWSSSVPAPGNLYLNAGPLELMDLNGDGNLDVNISTITWNELFKAKGNGVFGGGQQILLNVDLSPMFAPVSKGQRPAMFYVAADVTDPDYSTKIVLQLNTSPK